MRTPELLISYWSYQSYFPTLNPAIFDLIFILLYRHFIVTEVFKIQRFTFLVYNNDSVNYSMVYSVLVLHLKILNI